METSTCLPAYADRSMSHSCQPAELPLAACHVPVVPPAVHVVVPGNPVRVW